ncbi:MAG: NTP transferase domain-containing protein [Deltaproteobacteria bacterium]|nr:NTP transferase domain-containing protein [Deltaproteobacteria bacterium]MBI3294804.1 NTP transferase domain-containing protein [Deltaproteobacteria bacterium]
MKGIILAGGTGSRLFPLTKVTNKHLLPVGRKPMILHPVDKLVGAGIKDILIVTGVEHMGDVVNLLGSGKDFGCRFTYKVQDEAGGIAQALGLAENVCNDSKIVVILGDNIFTDDLTSYCQSFHEQKKGAKVLLKEVADPQRYGVAEVAGGKIIGIEEKPKKPKSSLAVTGIYFYDPEVFHVVKTLKPSHRNELEITDVNNAYIQKGEMTFETLKGVWTDAGTFESLWYANSVLFGEKGHGL